jgi:hypothetical protein
MPCASRALVSFSDTTRAFFRARFLNHKEIFMRFAFSLRLRVAALAVAALSAQGAFAQEGGSGACRMPEPVVAAPAPCDGAPIAQNFAAPIGAADLSAMLSAKNEPSQALALPQAQSAEQWIGRYNGWTLSPKDGDARGAWKSLVHSMGGREVAGEDGWVAVVPASASGDFAKAAQKIAPLSSVFEQNQVMPPEKPTFVFENKAQASDLVAVACADSSPDCDLAKRAHAPLTETNLAVFAIKPNDAGAPTVNWSAERSATSGFDATSFKAKGRVKLDESQMLIIGQPSGTRLTVTTFMASKAR